MMSHRKRPEALVATRKRWATCFSVTPADRSDRNVDLKVSR